LRGSARRATDSPRQLRTLESRPVRGCRAARGIVSSCVRRTNSSASEASTRADCAVSGPTTVTSRPIDGTMNTPVARNRLSRANVLPLKGAITTTEYVLVIPAPRRKIVFALRPAQASLFVPSLEAVHVHHIQSAWSCRIGTFVGPQRTMCGAHPRLLRPSDIGAIRHDQRSRHGASVRRALASSNDQCDTGRRRRRGLDEVAR
jgi:hypothetical protein